MFGRVPAFLVDFAARKSSLRLAGKWLQVETVTKQTVTVKKVTVVAEPAKTVTTVKSFR